MSKWVMAAFALMFWIPAFAEVTPDGPATSTDSDHEGHRIGQDAPLELDFQLGTFIGGRLKGTVYNSNSFGLAVEGLYGSDFVAFAPFSSDGSPSAYGGGLRADWFFSNSSHDAWLLSPALDVYDVNSRGAVFVAPNVDLSWLHQFSPHFGLVLGVQGGVQLGMSGHSQAGDSYSGQNIADIGTYIGARF